MAVNKLYPNAKDALAGVLRDGMTIMSGGFGLCGIPSVLIEAIRESGREGSDRGVQQCRAWTTPGWGCCW